MRRKPANTNDPPPLPPQNFRPSLESEAGPFLELARRIYQDFPKSVDKVFNPQRTTTTTAVEGPPTNAPVRVTQGAAHQRPVSTLDVYSSSSLGNVTQQQPAPPTRHGSIGGDNIMPPLTASSLSNQPSSESIAKSYAAGATTSANGVGVNFLKSTESFKV